jgi:membrane-bound lytic murein transglycosylase A
MPEAPPQAPGAPTPTPGESLLDSGLQTVPRARGPARWVPVGWDALPGLEQDRLAELWPALRTSCSRPPPGWSEFCARALLQPPADHRAALVFLQTWLRPWQLQTQTGQPVGLATGYFEPLLPASRQPSAAFPVPVHRPPADLGQRQPHWTREEMEMLPTARAALQGREIAWLQHPLDLLLLQIQGSGRLRVTEPDGRVRDIRVAFAGHNGHPYRSVGRWLVDRGELRADGANWPAIRAWAARHPQRTREMVWANPRVVYFREEALPDPGIGPRGAQGVPLTPGRSVAVDPLAVPYGTVLWIDTTEPLSSQPLRRAVVAQDTGSAITGAVRVDYFWGWDPEAEQQAGRMRQPLRAWALWPRQEAGPRDAVALN